MSKDDLLRFIRASDESEDTEPPKGLTPAALVEMYRRIILLRTFDERAVALQRQGRIGTYPMCWGEEGAQVGALDACRSQDWIFPSYRQQALGILRGIAPVTILKYRRGYGGVHGFWNARRYRVAPIAISIATHLPHATGLAWASKIRDDDVCAVAFFGDGATSEGDFHEAMNIAAVVKAPVVFFCTNNQWAISTPFNRQSATETVAEKAAAYGVPGVRVDGFDPIACWKATSDALDRARSGDGPTLVEALTYRLGPHATADDPSLYRDESETEPWRSLEPVGRLRGYLERRGLLAETVAEEMAEDARRSVSAAVIEMEASPRPGPETMFATTYASGLPWPLREGLAEFGPTEA